MNIKEIEIKNCNNIDSAMGEGEKETLPEWHLLKGHYSINSLLTSQKLKHPVIPAQAGIQDACKNRWIPACAGMTKNPDDCFK